DRLSGTAGPDQNGCAAQSVEDGAGCIEVPVTATDHDGERGIDRSGPATTDWGVQDTQAPLGAGNGDPASGVRTDGAHVEDKGARTCVGEHPKIGRAHV